MRWDRVCLFLVIFQLAVIGLLAYLLGIHTEKIAALEDVVFNHRGEDYGIQ